MRSALSDYEPMYLEHSPNYLMFGFWRQIGLDGHSFIVIEGDRNSGRVTAEIATNTVKTIPYYRLSDTPVLGTFGFRARVCDILGGFDSSHMYSSKDELERVMQEIITVYCHQGMRLMTEKVELAVKKAKSLWGAIYEEWLLAEQTVKDDGTGKRYRDLANEEEVRAFVASKLEDETVMRFMGKLRSKYKDDEFLNSHVYFMARGLDFLDERDTLDTLANSQMQLQVNNRQPASGNRITWSDIVGRDEGVTDAEKVLKAVKRNKGMTEPLPDLTWYLTGRMPQDISVKLGEEERERHWNYCFYKTFAVLEGLYRPQATKGMFEI